MAVTDKQTSGSIPTIRPELRMFDVEQLKFKEVEPGLFKRALPEGEGIMNIDYRPTKTNKEGHPKGRIYVKLEDGTYVNDVQELCEKYEPLAHHHLFQQKIWADKNLDGLQKDITHEENVSGEEPEVKEIRPSKTSPGQDLPGEICWKAGGKNHY